MNRNLYSFVILASTLSAAYNYAADGVTIETLALMLITGLISFIYFKHETTKRDELTYKSLSKMENVLITSKNSDQLFKKLCEILVEDANFKLCWTGTLKGNLIVPDVIYGSGSSYIQNAYLTIDEDKLESNGSSAQAIIKNIPIYHPILKNTVGTSLKTKLKKYKIEAALSIPIRSNGVARGVLTIYAENKDSFTSTTIKGITNLMTNVEIVLESFNNGNFFERVFEGSPNAIIITDDKSNIIQVNPKFTEITQYSAAEVIGFTPKILSSGKMTTTFYRDLWETVSTDGTWTGEIINKKKDGTEYTEFVTIYIIRSPNGHTLNYVAIFYDISEKKIQELRIHTLIYYDNLTQLKNRTFLEHGFDKIISKFSQTFVSMLLINVSDFKSINENFGYTFGDGVLKNVGARVSSVLGDSVYRLNDDKFLAIIENNTMSSVSIMCERLLKQLAGVYTVEGVANRFDFNIGISIYKTNGTTFTELLKYAGLALSRSKLNGVNTFAFYDSIFHAKSEYDLEVKNSLKTALSDSELSMKYQPIIDTVNKKIIGVEALLRWKSPKLGEINPTEFLSIAEYSGRAWDICDYAINECLRDLQSFKETMPELLMAINISYVQFKRKNFSIYFLDLLTNYQIDPSLICLEISSWSKIKDIPNALQTMTELSNYKIRIAIDDFGSNYDLSLLYNWPINKLKIDRELISNLETNHEVRAICQTIINMAISLQLFVIAEGIETSNQLQILTQMGCTTMQGFYFSKPIEKKQLLDFFHQFDIDII